MKHTRPATVQDAEYVAKHMRIEDKLEVTALGHDPLDSLLQGLTTSDICLTMVDPRTGEPGGLLGVRQGFDPQFGSIWLLGTPAIEQNTIPFLRTSRPCLQYLYDHTPYDAFYNWTHKDNTVHHAWLKWLGFTFIRRVNFGQHPFLEFVRLREN